jgi:hypothetical protein
VTYVSDPGLADRLAAEASSLADQAAVAFLTALDRQSRSALAEGDELLERWDVAIRLREWARAPGRRRFQNWPSQLRPWGVGYLRWEAASKIDPTAPNAFMPEPYGPDDLDRWRQLAAAAPPPEPDESSSRRHWFRNSKAGQS